MAAEIDVKFTAAIRTAGDPANDTTYDCPDEDPGCPYTTWVLCAFNASKTDEERVKFMSCWDDSCPGDSKWTCPHGATVCECKANASGLESASKTCSETAKLDFAAVSACQKGGAADLLHAAAVAWEEKWPSHAHTGPFQVPHVLIGGKDIGSNTTVPDLIKSLCADGVQAACKSGSLTSAVLTVV